MNKPKIKFKKVMKDYYKDHPEYYDSLNKFHKNSDINEIALDITKLIKKNNIKKVLDAGCGSGSLCFELQKMNPKVVFCGVDWSKYGVALANKNKSKKGIKCVFKQADIEKCLPFGKESFDLIISTQVIEHLVNPGKAILNMKHVLKKDGILYLRFVGLYRCFSMPLKYNLLKIADSFAMLFNKDYIKFRFIKPELKGVLEDTDMVYLSYVPEIARFIEKNNMTCIESDIRGKIIAVNGKSKNKIHFRIIRYFFQFFGHIGHIIKNIQ